MIEVVKRASTTFICDVSSASAARFCTQRGVYTIPVYGMSLLPPCWLTINYVPNILSEEATPILCATFSTYKAKPTHLMSVDSRWNSSRGVYPILEILSPILETLSAEENPTYCLMLL